MMRRNCDSMMSCTLNILFILGTLPNTSFAEGCPGNFNPISPGFTIEQIIQQCGEPNDRSEYKQIINETNQTGYAQEYDRYNQGKNSNQYSADANINNLSVTNRKEVTITKLRYGNTVLIFVDGKWRGSESR